ncbi:MAG: hypothetical protein K2L84_01515 [Muribaculaceae bacterium]|nr:hypothetical protein [Muribaculaceae bacterium]
MKKFLFPLLAAAAILPATAETVTVFDNALFYDGYLLDNHPEKDVNDGILRHYTYLYATKLTEEQLSKIGTTLDMKVAITACCDNYDRIGNVNIAFVPKGQESYNPDEVTRIETGRFITPFMNMNRNPKTVPYSYNVDFLSEILRDASLRENYDIWMELELFGIPYAANQQIAGCKDRNDVFKGTLQFETSEPAPLSTNNVLVPIVIKKPEYKGNNLNNYNANATDASLRENYDIWMELELFGIPYAANQQIAGCKDRNDVFKGTLQFETSEPAPLSTNNVLVPIVIKKPEYKGNNLNNYNANATDEVGKTEKTYTFEVTEDLADGQIVLITSNHGANAGGEEYNRRMHYVYIDGELVHSYRPGRTSCEPFRVYNTQTNGIYGYFKKSDAEWQSFSNWCPGDVIDNRLIGTGPISAGTHTVKISVPEAVFADGQGDIPVSMFFQGARKGSVPSAGIDAVYAEEWPVLKLDVIDNMLTVKSDAKIMSIEIHNLNGVRLHEQFGDGAVNTAAFEKGLVLVTVNFPDGRSLTQKVTLR